MYGSNRGELMKTPNEGHVCWSHVSTLGWVTTKQIDLLWAILIEPPVPGNCETLTNPHKNPMIRDYQFSSGLNYFSPSDAYVNDLPESSSTRVTGIGG